jgi:hypothetical protein
MKKHSSLSAFGLLWWIIGQGQGLQPNLINVYSTSTDEQHSTLQIIANNHHLQSNVNDLFLGYHKRFKRLSLWTIGGIGKQSLIHTKQLQAGSQIHVGQYTCLSQELILSHQRFPENNHLKQWQSNACLDYRNTTFHFRYLHHWNWANNNLSADLMPNHSIQVILRSLPKHRLHLILWQFPTLPSQFLFQHCLMLNQHWDLAWGLQWPNQKFWIVIKNKRTKIESRICLIAQPYFLPSLSQFHEITLD